MTEHNLPVPDDAPWLNLSPQEVEELRTKKQELTEYGKQKIRELMNDGKLKFYDKGKETFTIDGSSWGKIQTPKMKLEVEEMPEKVELTEKENKVLDIAKNIMEENKEAFQHLAAIERKEFAEKDFEDLTRNQRIQLALEEIDWLVIGGQDGQEFYNSIQFLRKVLRSLR